MGEFHLRKCKHTVEAGEIAARTCSSTTGAGCKRRLPQEVAAEESTGPREHGFRISNKRAARTCMMMPPAPSSSSGNVAPAESVVVDPIAAVSSCSTSTTTDCSSSSDAVVGEETMEKHLLLLQEEPRRLAHRLPFEETTVAAGRYRQDGSGRSSLAPWAAAPSCCSTNVEEEEGVAAVGTGELESTASNTTPGSNSSRSAPASARKRQPRDEAVAPPDHHEIEAFFAKAERDLARKFADKYNYDIVKDTPLEGRYQWARTKPY